MKIDKIIRVSTGSKPIDRLIAGGLETDAMTTVYGPAGSGKTNICLCAAISVARSGKNVIYIDAEGGFSSDRFLQLAPDGEELVKRISYLKPQSWDSQNKNFLRLEPVIESTHGLVIVDSITWLYRLALNRCVDYITKNEVNRDFSHQLAALGRIARTKKVPVLVSAQVYSAFDKRKQIRMVGGDLLEYTSKCLIELEKTYDGYRRASLRKHRSLKDAEVIFEIANDGLIDVLRREKKEPIRYGDFDEDPETKT